VSESVAAIVNDDIVSTYDLVQRMRLVAVTAGIQPSEETLPQLQREALRGLIEERLQIQELRRVEKENKIEIIANDQEVDAAIADMARENNNMTTEQLMGQLRAAGIGPETLRAQLRAEISWQGYINGRYRSRLRIGRDQSRRPSTAWPRRRPSRSIRSAKSISRPPASAACRSPTRAPSR